MYPSESREHTALIYFSAIHQECRIDDFHRSLRNKVECSWTVQDSLCRYTILPAIHIIRLNFCYKYFEQVCIRKLLDTPDFYLYLLRGRYIENHIDIDIDIMYDRHHMQAQFGKDVPDVVRLEKA